MKADVTNINHLKEYEYEYEYEYEHEIIYK
jgi:hypothetical protein